MERLLRGLWRKFINHNGTVLYVDSALPWRRISTIFTISFATNDMEWKYINKHLQDKYLFPNTVGTPYNTAPYITGSNIARLGHGSQNLWSKLWIPIVKSAPVRVIFTWKSVPMKSIHGSSDIYLGTWGTQWKQRHDSLWSYHSDVIVTFLWYGTIGILWHRDHQSTAKIDANCICLRFTGTWAHRHRHPVDSWLQARWTRSVLPK